MGNTCYKDITVDWPTEWHGSDGWHPGTVEPVLTSGAGSPGDIVTETYYQDSTSTHKAIMEESFLKSGLSITAYPCRGTLSSVEPCLIVVRTQLAPGVPTLLNPHALVGPKINNSEYQTYKRCLWNLDFLMQGSRVFRCWQNGKHKCVMFCVDVSCTHVMCKVICDMEEFLFPWRDMV